MPRRAPPTRLDPDKLYTIEVTAYLVTEDELNALKHGGQQGGVWKDVFFASLSVVFVCLLNLVAFEHPSENGPLTSFFANAILGGVAFVTCVLSGSLWYKNTADSKKIENRIRNR